MRRLTLAIAIAALHFGAVCALADDASRAAKVEEFLRLAKMEDMIRQTLSLAASQTQTGAIEAMLGLKVPPDAQKSVEAYQVKVNRIVMDALAWEKLKPDYVKLFADAYSEPELDDIISFYKSPTGQAMVERGPSLMVKASDIVQKRMAGAQSEIQKVTREFIKEAAERQERRAPEPR